MSYTLGGKHITSLDFDQIAVGDKSELRHPITQADVDAFASLTGDYNPLHVNKDFARRTMFRRPVVHGMLNASFISTMIGTQIPGSGALWLSQTLEFLAPAFVDDTITVVSTVEQKSAAARVVVLDTVIYNQHGHELVKGKSHIKLLEISKEGKPKMDEDARKVVLVTGASKGIGAAIARRLAEDGHCVAINYRSSRADAEALAESLTSQGALAQAFYADVSILDEVTRMVSAIEQRLGPICDLIHCAAPLPIPTPFQEVTWDSFQSQMETQLHGAFNCAKAALPIMLERGQGSMTFVGSIFVDGAPPTQQSAYVVAKAALTSFARTLAVELGPKGVRVNVIAPGMTQTDMISNLPDKVKMLTKMQTPLRRLADPDDIAGVAAFLMGPSARHITGETIRVSGGVTMV